MAKHIKVTSETSTGRNESFRDPVARKEMSRTQFVRAIEAGKYPDYHVRHINGKATPVSNPDRSEGNNLG